MADRVCSVDGCERSHSAKGLCASHYVMARQNDPNRPRCSVTDCAKTEYARGLCRVHYCDEHLSGYWKNRRQDPVAAAVDKAARDRWLAENPERRQTWLMAWRRANRERMAEMRRAWRAANPKRYRELGRRSDGLRRAREADAQIGEVDFAAILERDGMVCHICTGEIASMDDLHFDHVIPLSKGGPHTYDNIRPAHSWCNLRKGTKLLDSNRR